MINTNNDLLIVNRPNWSAFNNRGPARDWHWLQCCNFIFTSIILFFHCVIIKLCCQNVLSVLFILNLFVKIQNKWLSPALLVVWRCYILKGIYELIYCQTKHCNMKVPEQIMKYNSLSVCWDVNFSVLWLRSRSGHTCMLVHVCCRMCYTRANLHLLVLGCVHAVSIVSC